MALSCVQRPDPTRNSQKDTQTHRALALSCFSERRTGHFCLPIPQTVPRPTHSPLVVTHQTPHCCPHCSPQAVSSLQLSWEPGFPGTSWVGEQKVGGLNYTDLFKRNSAVVLKYVHKSIDTTPF